MYELIKRYKVFFLDASGYESEIEVVAISEADAIQKVKENEFYEPLYFSNVELIADV